MKKRGGGGGGGGQRSGTKVQRPGVNSNAVDFKITTIS